MKKILTSISIIGITAAVALSATMSYFSDTETSTGNSFTAGTIDLEVGNMSYLNGQCSPNTSWLLSNLTDQLFFNFEDLKPGMEGEDTVSLHLNGNKAWACFDITLTGTPENICIEPEEDATCGTNDGELQNELQFVFWADDGDNVLEDDEYVFLGPIPLSGFDGQPISLADSDFNVWTQSPGDPLSPEVPLYFIGKAWCFGDLTLDPVEAGFGMNPTIESGVICDGSGGTNITQTDGVVGNVSFYVVQSRNNSDFLCSELSLP